MTGLVIGKLHDDLMLLDNLANHPALQKNLLTFEIEMKEKRDIENSLKGIRGTAIDGLNFLQVRKSFWETSLPPTWYVPQSSIDLICIIHSTWMDGPESAK